ncbi:hypothetical protein [Aquabacter cavernae]|uniref:hypothetical protein n=1 Tax=Aquabacter cavernae TaxID=2496029 RepID=UPI0013E09FBD|nr:hypothetical protein [Aquabacter cavernae]
MTRSMTLIFGAVIFAAALGAAVMFSGRGTPEPTESAPANVPAAPMAPATPTR